MESLRSRSWVPQAVPKLIADRKKNRWHEWIPRKLSREGVVIAQHVREGRFQRTLSLITGMSALLAGLEVSYEHYRGSYGNRAMYSPILLTPPLVGAGLWAVFDRRASKHALPAISALTIADGLIGTFFHVRGIQRKPGGWRVPVFNLVMGPPVMAPLLFAIPGYLGLIASYLRREDDPLGRFQPALPRTSLLTRLFGKARRAPRPFRLTWRREVREGRFQRHLAAAASASAVFSGFEALYSHYKNGFRFKAQWSPVILAPLLAAAGAGAVFNRKAAHTWLPAMSALAIADGGIGFAYHARGVLRRPGGTKHLPYNVMYGPPIFAPLLFAASGFLGVLASLMRRER
jgi:hypothetical protein